MFMDFPKNRGFFTLISMLLAIVIIAVWMTLVMPKYLNKTGDNNDDFSQGTIIDSATGAVISDPRGAIQKAKDAKKIIETPIDGNNGDY